jgi:FAD/FMN-containing dehydrogenase
MNVHGKNAWKVGTIGDNIQEFEILLPDGRTLSCSREENKELFFGAIGGIGMLGTIISLKINLKRIYSGLLEVHALASRNLTEMFQQFDEHLSNSDYLVGWIDAFAKGDSLGRGQIHRANYLSPGQDLTPKETLQPNFQHLPDRMFSVIPRSLMWRMMRPFLNDPGSKIVNMGKYLTSRISHDSQFRQSHVAFHFLLDYIPDWKLSYGPGGLVQYQCFVPKENALVAFQEILERCQMRKIVNYLSVLKRHRPDNFLISHGVDGYSLAMDFRVTAQRRKQLQTLAAELDEIVIEAGGRFYLAKDSTLHPETINAFLGKDTVQKFNELKKRYDPEMRLQTNMWRRLFAAE